MKIDILCSSANHPANYHLMSWMKSNEQNHNLALCRQKIELRGGDILFLISCSELIDKNTRDLYRYSLVIHASDLPQGRGWSPHIWQVIEGKQEIQVSLLEAEDAIDSGAIWREVDLAIPKTALWDEINKLLFDAELELMNFALTVSDDIDPQPQDLKIPSSYYPKRTPADSELDPDQSLRDQFNLIRVCDPERFPAFFELHGQRYIIRLEKMKDDNA